MNAERSETVRWAEASEEIHDDRTLGCGPNHRPYIETAMNGSIESSFGLTRAAAIVPIPLTSISSGPLPHVGPTYLNDSTSTRSARRTTIGHRSKSAFQPRPRHQSEFHASGGPISNTPAGSGGGRVASRSRTTAPGGGVASCRRATSASIVASRRHGSRRLPIFQPTTAMPRRALHSSINPTSSLGTPALAEEGGDPVYDCPRDVLLAHQRQLLWAAGSR